MGRIKARARVDLVAVVWFGRVRRLSAPVDLRRAPFRAAFATRRQGFDAAHGGYERGGGRVRRRFAGCLGHGITSAAGVCPASKRNDAGRHVSRSPRMWSRFHGTQYDGGHGISRY